MSWASATSDVISHSDALAYTNLNSIPWMKIEISSHIFPVFLSDDQDDDRCRRCVYLLLASIRCAYGEFNCWWIFIIIFLCFLQLS